MNDFTLHHRLAEDTLPVSRLDLCDCLLMNDQRFYWLILVPRLTGLRDLHEVPREQQPLLMRDIERASIALQQIARPFKLNVAALGNQVEQLHIHVIARHQHDPAWPNPVWGQGPAEPYADSAAAERIRRLQQHLSEDQTSA